MNPAVTGLLAFGVLALALLATYAFRNMWNRH
ncbi:hypothetical protein Xcel_2253 [Xylanimonas cellulosilytica DSM 15894]|uniref:Uncharacterized protein n=1 Tax=Xylanimonas cellulosilytica (strain DSM 15894 / JCM 12276 / CECT 5975 / KCTC 9989 / LMG 20990 / NBRC 107835 / XIL07) TaxID=446471 RepID=D1BV32_XYLCX|nr:hypothetical protein Xcel_2253 [Xylanimonas cellulosilytica DSM 15894]